MRNYGALALAALLVAAIPLIATDARARSEKEAGSFSSTGVDDDASGTAKLSVRDLSDGKLEVRVKNLDPNATYDVLVDGVGVGQFTTNSGGSGRLSFRSYPRSSRDTLLGFDPRGALIVVRNAAGQDVLATQLSGTSPVGAGEIVCCIPDDSGPECEDRTPAECAAQGGTPTTATSCLPNPCAGSPPPIGDDVICCIPDDSGPECEDRSADECALQGGVVIAATSCLPTNPCLPVTPPANQDIQCCLADDSGPECEDRTPSQCAVEGGVNAGVGICMPNPCESIPPPSGNATLIVKCEVRSDRSRVSVDGSNLATGSYKAAALSGLDSATSGAHPTVGDQVEFDFDSDSGDIAAGATAIPANFIQGSPPQVTGRILTLGDNVVIEATVDCVVK